MGKTRKTAGSRPHGANGPSNHSLAETEHMLRGLGMDAESLSAIKAITDEIINECAGPKMPSPDEWQDASAVDVDKEETE